MGLIIERASNVKVADVRQLNDFHIGNVVKLAIKGSTHFLVLERRPRPVLYDLKYKKVKYEPKEVMYELVEEESQITY